ncbi:hypothetical protein ACFB49_06680 [Sphingomonas sp. DBB INV C78]
MTRKSTKTRARRQVAAAHEDGADRFDIAAVEFLEQRNQPATLAQLARRQGAVRERAEAKGDVGLPAGNIDKPVAEIDVDEHVRMDL